jgi:probable F420-dependent oxidoreductase
VALGYAAAATSKLKLGAGITLLAQRDPIWTAKEAATVDYLSGGRLIFGIGYGWNKEEMAHHGTEYLQRRALLREKVLMVKSLWTEDEASYDGELLSLEPSWAWPKPVQKPHPPIVLGADVGPKTLGDIVEFCDGWIPNAARYDIADQITRVREALREAGRDPAAFEVTAYAAKKEKIEELRDAGVDRVVFSLPPLGADVVIPRLGMLAEMAGLTS